MDYLWTAGLLRPESSGIGVVAPVAAFSADVLFGTVSFTVTFTDESTKIPTSWDWDFGDGTAHSTDQNPTHEYTTAGVYTVTLIATNAAGNDTEEKTDYISAYREVTLTLQPDDAAGEDVFIDSSNAAANFSTDARLLIGENNAAAAIRRALIKFNLSSIPDGAIIDSATLSLFMLTDLSSNARTFRVYRQKRAWVETQATWSIYSTGNSWATAGGFGADDCEQTAIGSRDFTATETVAEFKNFALTPVTKAALDLGNGWLIKADTETDDQYNFASCRSSTAGNRPKLVVVYRTTVPA